MKRNISVLGSTGSIGLSSLDVIRNDPESYNVVSLVCGENIDILLDQIKEFSPSFASVRNVLDIDKIKKEFPNLDIASGSEGIFKAVSEYDIDTVIVAIPGTTALEATLEAIKKGYRICLANKETMVAAGDLMNKSLEKSGSELIPVDSEQSAIFQVLEGNRRENLKKVILTASGGPFFKRDLKEFKNISVNDALQHPTWNMGKKITIDSATLMNKALEIVESKYLFNLKKGEIDVIIHPQSIIHSMVEYNDASILAQISTPDMRLPIQYSLNYPERKNGLIEELNFSKLGKMEFFEVNSDKFPSINMALEVFEKGNDSGLIFNASNEVAVDSFIRGDILFTDIYKIVYEMLQTADGRMPQDIDEIISRISDTKLKTKEIISRKFI